MVLRKLYDGVEIFSILKQIRICFKDNTIILLDGDRYQLLFLPLLIYRTIRKWKSIAFLIHVDVISKDTSINIIKKIGARILYYLPYCYSVSINRALIHPGMYKYFNFFIYDIQCWDLKYLNYSISEISDIDVDNIKRPIILVFGAILNEKRNRNELIGYVKRNSELPFSVLFSCKLIEEDYKAIAENKDCLSIDRYVTNEEMMYLFAISDYIYCYYDDNIQRPSGVFGRALQLGKHIIVKKGGYLDSAFNSYSGLLPINNIDEIQRVIDIKSKFMKTNVNYDDSSRLYQLIFEL